jgi:hypothetical protein
MRQPMTAKRTRLSLPKIEPNMINESQPKSFLVQRPSIVRNLDQLISSGARFSTIYADPPWDYDNTASRGAAVNHYSTIDLETWKH